MIAIAFKGRRKVLLLVCFSALMRFAFQHLNEDQQDRYSSIINSGTKNAATAQGRWDGVIKNFELALRHPLFGFGLGTSREANANFSEDDKPAHNLYAEIAQEMGLTGLVIFILFIKSIVENVSAARKRLREASVEKSYLSALADAIQVWLLMNIVFSLASYGLSSYEWYLSAGLSVVVRKLAMAEPEGPDRSPRRHAGRYNRRGNRDDMRKRSDKTRILTVVRHPVGGIRTYLKYTYGRLDKEKYSFTILTVKDPEASLIRDDLKGLDVEVIDLEGRHVLLSMACRSSCSCGKKDSTSFTPMVLLPVLWRFSATRFSGCPIS